MEVNAARMLGRRAQCATMPRSPLHSDMRNRYGRWSVEAKRGFMQDSVDGVRTETLSAFIRRVVGANGLVRWARPGATIEFMT